MSAETAHTRPRTAFLSYGFRPFFLLAAAWAVIALVVLLAAFRAGAWPADAPPFARWHGHEMLFGFVGAAVAGFLLTAVPTWTSSRPVSGGRLAALAVIWLAGRAVMSPWLGVHDTPLVLVDALFFPAVAVAIGAALIAARNYRNFQFMLLLAVLTVADLLFHAVPLGWLRPLPFDALRLAVNVVMLMIGVIGGRIVPLFTRSALLREGVQTRMAPLPWLERMSTAALAAVLIVDVAAPDGTLAGVIALLAAVLLGARLSRWHGHRTLGMPIVWILHAGYAWVAVALALKAGWLLLGAVWAVNWLHALTAGAFGTMVLGVMTRVALGHSGRPLVVARSITVAYVLVIAGAAIRVAAPALAPAAYVDGLTVAMALWAGAFAIFLAKYVTILVAPRVDA